MSGHSKWSTIKHKKGREDAKRGRMFSKLTKEITVAAKIGGGDITANPRLRTAVANAKAVNMPLDNIQRAVKKGTGELEGVSYEEITYEGYGPAGVAVFVEVLTDNRNRSASDVRRIFSRNNGALGENGSVAWMFEKKGLITFEKNSIDENELMEIAIEAGAEDVTDTGEGFFEVYTGFTDFFKVRDDFDEKGLKYASAEIDMIPQSTVELGEKEAHQILKLIDALDDHDDVQNVFANFDIPNDVMEKLSE